MSRWLNQNEYPFKSKFFETSHGKIHYIDEGSGDILLFVHGTPAWSFLWRNYIKALSKNYRCIALDHLGFGLSDKPIDFAGTPQRHADNLSTFIHHLDLANITLIVHDFGGPIGLSNAIKHSGRIKQLVLFNTWLWATAEDPAAQRVDKILHSWFGNFIYLNTNFSPNFLFKNAFHNKKLLSPSIHKQYKKPFPNKATRHGLLKIGKSLIGSSNWYQEQWNQIHKIDQLRSLILWGDKDPFIKESHLNIWLKQLKEVTLHRYEAGHFVQEEAFDNSLQALKNWLDAE